MWFIIIVYNLFQSKKTVLKNDKNIHHTKFTTLIIFCVQFNDIKYIYIVLAITVIRLQNLGKVKFCAKNKCFSPMVS